VTAPEGASERLRRAQRIKRRADFRAVQGTGTRAHTRSFLILLRPSAVGERRVGITVTKKVGNAVARNRIKRVVREVFRRNLHFFPDGFDFVFIAKRDAPPVSYEGVREEVRRARKALDRAARKAETSATSRT